MTEPTHAAPIINRTFIHAPIDTVWSTLVATDKVLPFFFGAICETENGLRENAKMRMVHPNRKIAMVVGEVLRFDPPTCYAHTFRMTSIDEPPCQVTYNLREKDGGTEFELVIENAVEGSELLKQMKGGQRYIASNLKSVCETGRPAISGRLMVLMAPVIALFAKRKQRVKNWPLT